MSAAGDDDENGVDVAAYGLALADSVDAALPGWVRDAVEVRAGAAGVALDPAVREAVEQAVARARADVTPRLRDLLAADVDEQRSTPLSVLRAAAAYPTAVLRDLGVPPVDRDDDDVARFPDDHYGLVPVSFADFGPEAGEAGLRWGAAKAFEHKRRHRG